MGEAELDTINNILTIHSHIITYGNAADEIITERIRGEIEEVWNEPKAGLQFKNLLFTVVFKITAQLNKALKELEVLQNTDPRNNFFRIEEFVNGNISFVDGIGSNSGFLSWKIYTKAQQLLRMNMVTHWD